MLVYECACSCVYTHYIGQKRWFFAFTKHGHLQSVRPWQIAANVDGRNRSGTNAVFFDGCGGCGGEGGSEVDERCCFLAGQFLDCFLCFYSHGSCYPDHWAVSPLDVPVKVNVRVSKSGYPSLGLVISKCQGFPNFDTRWNVCRSLEGKSNCNFMSSKT